jgi:plastocyanin domain-containing protein
MDTPTLVRIAFVLVVPAVAAGWLAWELSRKPKRVVRLTTDGVQEATVLVRNGYHPETIRVRAGWPVRLVFQRAEATPCSSRVYLAEPPLSRYLPPFAATAIVFTPDRVGTYLFTCEEGRFRGRLIVEPPSRASRLSRASQDPLSTASVVRAMLGAKRPAERRVATLEGI